MEIKVVKRNKFGGKFIEEPEERKVFREKCKSRRLGCLCDKGCYFDYNDRCKQLCRVHGCLPKTYCKRMKAWDKKHGIGDYLIYDKDFDK